MTPGIDDRSGLASVDYCLVASLYVLAAAMVLLAVTRF
jgi:hypothetical protein